MNREIKFREYNSHWKKMYAPFTLINAITAGGISDRYNKHSIFMQYTGLKDKNGKEIYERDVVTRGRNLGGQEQEHHIVIFDYDFLSFLDRTPENIIEVIGNIYENSELLDNK